MRKWCIAPFPPHTGFFSKNSPGLWLKLKQLFAKGGHLAARGRPAWWLWQRQVHCYRSAVVESGVHRHLWDQQKRHSVQMGSRWGIQWFSSLRPHLVCLHCGREVYLFLRDRALYHLVLKGAVIRFEAASSLEASVPCLRENSFVFRPQLSWALSSGGCDLGEPTAQHPSVHPFVCSFIHSTNKYCLKWTLREACRIWGVQNGEQKETHYLHLWC